MKTERGVALEFSLDDGDHDLGNEAANLRCIRELLRLPADGHFAWDVRWQGLKAPESIFYQRISCSEEGKNRTPAAKAVYGSVNLRHD
jgi:hypothetical protein